jgi:hypothetical protein
MPCISGEKRARKGNSVGAAFINSNHSVRPALFARPKVAGGNLKRNRRHFFVETKLGNLSRRFNKMTGNPWLLAGLAAALLGGGAVQDGFERERTAQNMAAKNALEGKAPPELAGEWFNTSGKALDWKTLKGKVVILDFWAHW